MSPAPVKVMFQSAIRDAELPAGTKLVALVLSTYMRADGCAWPSVGTLAMSSDRSDRQVRRAVRELERAGLVVVVQRPGKRSTYLATPDTDVRPTPDIRDADPGHTRPKPRTPMSAKGVRRDIEGHAPAANGAGPASAAEANAEFRRRLDAGRKGEP